MTAIVQCIPFQHTKVQVMTFSSDPIKDIGNNCIIAQDGEHAVKGCGYALWLVFP